MGIEKLIPGDTEPAGERKLEVMWRHGNSYTEIEQAVIDDAIEFGLTLPIAPIQGDTLVGWVIKDEKGIVTIAIGKVFKNETRPIIGLQICHILMVAPGNPFELHWRFWPGAEPTISMERLERVEKTALAIKYTKSLCSLIPRIGNLYEKSRSGRPLDSGTFPHQRRELLDKAYEAISNKPGLSWNSATIRSIINSTENTVRDWRKKHLQDIVPRIKQLRQSV